MFITALSVDGYKNLSGVQFAPDRHHNLIIGRNAQGKTNLLEAIWLMTGCKSFRGVRERDYIGFDVPLLQMELRFQDSQREQQIQYGMQKGGLREKRLKLNGVPLKSASHLFAQFKCVVFTPDDTELIKGTPEKRRSFVDLCYSQLHPKAMDYIRKYDALIGQRNTVLKAILARNAGVDQLAIWDQQLAAVGAYLSFQRHAYLQKLNESCAKLYDKITAGKEHLSVSYQSNVYSDYDYPEKPDRAMAERYYERLQAGIEDDIRLGYTTCGAGRDDVILKIDGLSVRDFGSQGQQKSTALVLKLAQAEIYYADQSESPVILLDDVMGELDTGRQNLVYEIVQDMQVFITTCNEDAVTRHDIGKRVRMENGVLTEIG